uniref:SAYSvFN domain-containing protein n=1 Tax=Leersia perrieri TaxID=77586 RepID=A0A0D9XH51_9ORYZ
MAAGEEPEMVEVTLRAVGPSRPSTIRLPPLMVAVAPKPPANHLRDDADDDDDEEELKFKIPETTTWWKRKIFIFLRDKLRLPDILLMALFSLNMKAWVLIAMWFLFAPIAQMYEVGPLYILGTGFVVILCNLGRRQQGDVSAYSIFNEDFRELPGTLNADRIDRDIRAGGKMINPPSNRQKYSLSLTPL